MITHIKKNNDSIATILKSLCRVIKYGNKMKTSTPKPIINAISNILNQIEKCSVAHVIEITLKALESSVLK